MSMVISEVRQVTLAVCGNSIHPEYKHYENSYFQLDLFYMHLKAGCIQSPFITQVNDMYDVTYFLFLS